MPNITGSLTGEYKSAVITIKIRGQVYQALIDTGRYYCAIRQDVIYAIKKVPDSYHTVFSAIEGPVKKPLYSIDFELGETFFTEEFMYLDWFTHPIVIGTKFLSKHWFRYDGLNNLFELII